MRFIDWCIAVDAAHPPKIDARTNTLLFAAERTLDSIRFLPSWVVTHKGENSRRQEAYEWCVDNCQGRYAIVNQYAFFTDEIDAVHYRLKWGDAE